MTAKRIRAVVLTIGIATALAYPAHAAGWTAGGDDGQAIGAAATGAAAGLATGDTAAGSRLASAAGPPLAYGPEPAVVYGSRPVVYTPGVFYYFR
jgi:hypothetical protein